MEMAPGCVNRAAGPAPSESPGPAPAIVENVYSLADWANALEATAAIVRAINAKQTAGRKSCCRLATLENLTLTYGGWVGVGRRSRRWSRFRFRAAAGAEESRPDQ